MLRVKDWDKNFENNRSRDLQEMQWVPFPNRHDGDGITELLDHPNGMAHYGAWVLLVQVASKCGKPAPRCGPGETPRGTLRRDNGKPHDARSIARVSGGDLNVFEEAIPRLLAIGWIEVIPDEPLIYVSQPQNGLGIPQEGAGIPQEGAGQLRESAHRMEENGKEKNTPPLSPVGSQPQEGAGIPQEGAGQLRESAGIPGVSVGSPQADGEVSVPTESDFMAEADRCIDAYLIKRTGAEVLNKDVFFPSDSKTQVLRFLRSNPGYPLRKWIVHYCKNNRCPKDFDKFLRNLPELKIVLKELGAGVVQVPQETQSEKDAREDREIANDDYRFVAELASPIERGDVLERMSPERRARIQKRLLENEIPWEMPGTRAAFSAAGGARE